MTATGRTVAAGATANLAVGTLFAWSLVAEQAAADVGATGAVTSAVFATAIATFAVTLLAVGRLDPQPPSRFLLVAAAVVAGAGLGLAAVSQDPVTLWFGVGLLFGAANGLAYGVAAGMAARAPAARRGAVTGVVVAAYAAGPILLGAAGPRLVAVEGWRACVGGLAVVVTVLLLVAAGLAPGDQDRHQWDEKDGAAAEPVGRGTVLLLWLVFAGGVAPALLVFAHALQLAAARGLGPGASGIAVSVLAAGNLLGRVGGGWLSDSVGRVPGLALALAATGISVGVLATDVPPGVVLTAFTTVGVSYGTVSVLIVAVTTDRVGVRAFPRAYGWVFTAWGCAGLIAPVAGDALLGAGGQARALIAVAALPLLPAALALLALARLNPPNVNGEPPRPATEPRVELPSTPPGT
ncbi:MFS transporter (plasmid) [Rhodococcus antarcticus]|uniref:MFS transporter n=1 Tax=Rhodococcus antarcticus TaxID=2987751 RepID=A0ABY6P5B2_9NOCA|nr:MFS transporter [Rhodococcus antarcticus]UZJ26857.1 MFS transporter [Rhodococcus antarcticus]